MTLTLHTGGHSGEALGTVGGGSHISGFPALCGEAELWTTDWLWSEQSKGGQLLLFVA